MFQVYDVIKFDLSGLVGLAAEWERGQGEAGGGG